MPAPDLTQQLLDAASQPNYVAVDGTVVIGAKAAEVILLDQYLASRAAGASGRSGWMSLRPARVVPPGATGPHTPE